MVGLRVEGIEGEGGAVEAMGRLHALIGDVASSAEGESCVEAFAECGNPLAATSGGAFAEVHLRIKKLVRETSGLPKQVHTHALPTEQASPTRGGTLLRGRLSLGAYADGGSVLAEVVDINHRVDGHLYLLGQCLLRGAVDAAAVGVSHALHDVEVVVHVGGLEVVARHLAAYGSRQGGLHGVADGSECLGVLFGWRFGIRCQLTLHLVGEFEIGIGGAVDGIDGWQVALHRILVAGEVADGGIAPVASQRPHAHYHAFLALGHSLGDDEGGV